MARPFLPETAFWRNVVVAIMMAGASPAIAHDPGEPFAEWYQSLVRPDTGGPCCSLKRDCGPVKYQNSPPVAEGDSDYEAFVGGQWIRVPDRAVLKRHDNPTGSGVLCRGPASGYIMCFIPGDDL